MKRRSHALDAWIPRRERGLRTQKTTTLKEKKGKRRDDDDDDDDDVPSSSSIVTFGFEYKNSNKSIIIIKQV